MTWFGCPEYVLTLFFALLDSFAHLKHWKRPKLAFWTELSTLNNEKTKIKLQQQQLGGKKPVVVVVDGT